jgi:hypothetical protein
MTPRMVCRPAMAVGAFILLGCSKADDQPAVNVSDSPIASLRWAADSANHHAYVPPISDTLARALIPSCSDQPPVLSADSVGPIQLRSTLQNFLDTCKQAVFAWALSDHPDSLRPVALVRSGSTVIEIFFADTSVSAPVERIVISDSTARTKDGLSIGERFEQFTHVYGPYTGWERDCHFYAEFSQARWIRIELQYPHEVECEVEDVPTRHVEPNVPKESTVIGITVFVAPPGA